MKIWFWISKMQEVYYLFEINKIFKYIVMKDYNKDNTELILINKC